MTFDKFDLISRDGLKLYGQAWLPDNEPDAVMCLVHGHGEHIGRYEHVGSFFASQGIAVFGADLRGHGRSEGKKGHTPSYDHLLEDVEDLMKKARVEFIETPMFLYGHSMGGNLVANFLTNRKTLELEGAILTSPWLRLSFEPPKVKMKLGKLMRKMWPAFSVPSELDVNEISSVTAEVHKYANDPLVHDRISAQLSLSILEAGERALEKATDLNIPVLVVHGGDDKITSPDASRQFAAQAPDFVQLKIWDNLKHETHNEVNQEEVLQFSLAWLRSQTSSRQSE